MEQPNVSSKIRDEERDITYDVRAYRALSREELVETVRHHRARAKRKDKRGDTVVILTIIGFRD